MRHKLVQRIVEAYDEHSRETGASRGNPAARTGPAAVRSA